MTTTRILDLKPPELASLCGRTLLDSIRSSEGRTLLCETVVTSPPLLGDISNGELAAAMGADLLLLNIYDVYQPYIAGIDSTSPLEELKRRTGRCIGVNLEPVPAEQPDFPPSRRANRETARLAFDQGASFVVLTGNPHSGVDNETICKTLSEIKTELGDRLVVAAGKMHGAGVGEPVMTDNIAHAFLAAGADILLLPAPGTVPGVTLEQVWQWTNLAHRQGKLAISAIGTSQEGADLATIRHLALDAKKAGVDIHHLGDAGYFGVALPENIQAYSIAIRGRRHTFRRMAMRV